MPKFFNVIKDQNINAPKNRKPAVFGNFYVLVREKDDKSSESSSSGRSSQDLRLSERIKSKFFPTKKQTNEKIIDILTKPVLDIFSEEEYCLINDTIKKYRVRETISYIRSILGVPSRSFRNPDGSDFKDVSLKDFNDVVSLIHKIIAQKPSEFNRRDLSRMPTSVMVHWIYELDKSKKEIIDINQRVVVERLIEKNKTRWLSHKLSIASTKKALKQDSQVLRDQGLSVLADFAYRADRGACLYEQLPIVDNFRFYKTQLNDNIYGSAFESAFIDELIKKPPQSLLSTMSDLAQGLKGMLFEMSPDDIETSLMPKLFEKIHENKRPWFAKIPKIQEFLAVSRGANLQEANRKRLAILQEILEAPVADGFQCILIAYLAQKFYIVRYPLSHLITDKENRAWISVTQRLYTEVDSLKVSGVQKGRFIHPFKKDRLSAKSAFVKATTAGITADYQPPIVSTFTGGPVDRPTTHHMVNLDHSSMPSAVRDALTYGIPFATGISGTTNIYLGTISHLITDSGREINAPLAFLGLLMFLVYDGGHSIHEAIWMLNYRETKGNKNKYTSLGFDVERCKTRSIKKTESYVSDYLSLRKLYNGEILNSFDSAVDNAWERLINYFGKVSVYKDGINENTYHYNFYIGDLVDNFCDKLSRFGPIPDDKILIREVENLILSILRNSKIEIKKIEAVNHLIDNFDKILKIKNEKNPEIGASVKKIIFCIYNKECKELSDIYINKNAYDFFGNINQNTWKLVSDKVGHRNMSPFCVDQGPEYVGAMTSGLQIMYKYYEMPLTLQHIDYLYGHIVYDFERSYDPIKYEMYEYYNRMEEKSARCAYNQFESRYDLILKVEPGKNQYGASESGVAYLFSQMQNSKDALFSIEDYVVDQEGRARISANGKIATLVIPKRKKADLQKYVKKMISNYELEMRNLPSRANKTIPIIRLCKKLAVAHIFQKFNTEFVMALLANKLLLQNHLDPVVWDDFRNFIAFSIDENSQALQKAQQNFQDISHTLNIKENPSHISDHDSNFFESAKHSKSVEVFFPEKSSDVKAELVGDYVRVESSIKTGHTPEFQEGYASENYSQIPIPGFHENMKLMDMYALALEGSLSLKQFGALAQHISQKQFLELTPEEIETSLWSSYMAFKDLHGYDFRRPLSQGLFASTVAPTFSGFCSGLTWAMGVALAKGGKTAFENLAQKIEDSIRFPDSEASSLLKQSLVNLHFSANATLLVRQQSKQGPLTLPLAAILLELLTLRATKFYELGTENHTMLLGAVVENSVPKFYFYDPNYGLVEYSSAIKLMQVLEKYFSNHERLEDYRPFQDRQVSASKSEGSDLNEPSPLKFELQSIDITLCEKLILLKEEESFLLVEDLIKPESLIQSFEARRETQAVKRSQASVRWKSELESSAYPKGSLSDLSVKYLARNALISFKRLKTTHALSDEKIPLLAKMEQTSDGYRIPFLDRTNLKGEPTWVETRDDTLFKAKTYIDVQAETLARSHVVSENFELGLRPYVMPDIHIDGLNAGFGVQQLIAWVQKGNREEQVTGSIAENLATALSIHSYIGMTQIAQGTVHDMVSIASLVEILLKPEKAMVMAPVSVFTKSLTYGSQGLGTGLMVFSAALDAYEVIHAENVEQSSLFKTQLAFDTVGSALSIAGIGASVAGYTTAAGVMGPIGVIVGGLGVGAAGLAQAYGALLEDTKTIATYFTEVDKAYGLSYTYRADKKQMTFTPGAVIKEIDLRKNTDHILYDSQYLYGFDYRAVGYIDSDSDNGRRQDAMVLRSLLERPETCSITTDHKTNAEILILPSTRKTYIHAYTEEILGIRSTARGDEYNALRTMERNSNGRFRVEHFFFPYERIIREISQEPVATAVTLRLDENSRTLLVPQLPQELWGKNLHASHPLSNAITYTLFGWGGTYGLVLNKGAEIVCSSEGSSTPSSWIIDTRSLEKDDVTFGDKTLVVNGVTVRCLSWERDTFHVIKHDMTSQQVDFSTATPKFLVNSLDTKEWAESHSQPLEEHLKDLAAHHELGGTYTLLSHYTHNGIPVGNAYYDRIKDRMLFSHYGLTDHDLDSLDAKITSVINGLERPVFARTHRTLCQGDFVDAQYLLVKERKKIEIPTLVVLYWFFSKDAECLEKSSRILTEEFSGLLNNLALWAAKDKMVIEESTSRDSSLTPQKKGCKRSGTKDEFIPYPDLHKHSNVNLPVSLSHICEEISRLRSKIPNLRAALRLCREAELAGVIESQVYFYHRGKNVLWSADLETHQVQKQFICPISAESVRFWQDKDALYIAYKALLRGTPDKGEFVCRIQGEEMTLVSLLVEDATTDESIIEYLGKSAICYIPPLWTRSSQPHGKNFPDSIPTVTMRRASFITISGKNREGLQQHYWVKDPIRVIQFNAPESHKIPADLSLVLHIETLNQKPIFYFYSIQEKILFRQEDYGMSCTSEGDPLCKTANATRVIIDKLADVFVVEKQVYAVTEDGFLYSVDERGETSLVALSEKWFITRRLTWRQDLELLARIHPVLPIIGIKNTDDKNLSAWSYQGYLIISSLSQITLKVLDVDPKGAYALLLDASSKKVYKQSLMDDASLSVLFDQSFVFQDTSTLPEVVDLLPETNLKSVARISDSIAMTTDQGVILGFDYSQTPHAVGVDETWLAAHQEDFETAITALLATWPHKDNLFLKGRSVPTWYHIASRNQIKATGLSAADNPFLIGLNRDQDVAYIACADKGLYAYVSDGTDFSFGSLISKNHVQRRDRVLTIEGNGDTKIHALDIESCDTLLLSGGAERQTYIIDQSVRKNITCIIIDNYDPEQDLDDIWIEVKNCEAVTFSQKDDDLLLMDDDGVIQIKNVFSTHGMTYQHAMLTLSDRNGTFSQSLSDIVEYFSSSADEFIHSTVVQELEAYAQEQAETEEAPQETKAA